MNVQSFSEHMARVRGRVLNQLLSGIGTHDAVHAGWGLPADAVRLVERKLIVASTPCEAPLFHPNMREAAAATGADVILAHHRIDPLALDPVRFSVLVQLSGEPYLFGDMVLFTDPAGDHWLLPPGDGLFLALDRDGLRASSEPPFLTFHQRCQGVSRASAALAHAVRYLEAA